MKQKTIRSEVRFSGVGLHTGNKVEAVIKPAGIDNGINFIRKDLNPPAKIEANIEYVYDVVRGTALKKDGFEVYTVEHILAACAGLGIFNVDIEINSNEFPVGDGSAEPFVKLFEEVGIVELEKEQEVYEVNEVIEISNKDTFIVIKPDKEFKISFTIDYDHPVINSQFKELVINEDTFKKEIMFARTFGFYKDFEKLKNLNKAGGSSLENTIGLDEEKVLNKEGLRAEDEFVRHKMLDLIGDLCLIGVPIKAHVIAIKVGHAVNVEIARKIVAKIKSDKAAKNALDIQQIRNIIPHRYPFLLVDKIIEQEDDVYCVGIKNVTANEEYFNGHFPVRSVMPGVLIIEALAQLSGVFMMSKGEHKGKLPFFVGIDKVRFRKPVVPGDVLRLEVRLKKLKGSMGRVEGFASVDGKLVASGDLMFSIVDA
ncbi:MAG: UDP-3-O-acyl-N-acetylglucosamine deacetylase [Candidatus Muirbacterium halophilum]|nr:UDP-3-O-acyl-N-acetylglucosamine deacetylase [Candidatus Muirbacterium halophilum]MCK9474770.1 UDP-3-O-acyl-N-acetylglucosamine deacetylase [Candidatus Muirbacterium halophilum]